MRQQRPGPAVPAVDPAQVEQLVSDLRRRLSQAGRPPIAEETRRTLGADVPCYGVRPAEVHRIGMDFVRRMRTGALPLALEFGEPLWRSGNLEEGLVAGQVLAGLGRHITGADFERADAWAGFLTNAHTADALATSLISHTLAAKPSLVAKLLEWAKSPSPWRRRAAIAAFGPSVREKRFLTDALEVAALLMTDQHPDVQTAVGNLLMEASRLQAPRVVEFLKEWKDRTSRQVLQVGATKLSPEDRKALLS